MITTRINNCLRRSISFHNALHRFRQGRGTGMVTLEDKLAQQLVDICHEALIKV